MSFKPCFGRATCDHCGKEYSYIGRMVNNQLLVGEPLPYAEHPNANRYPQYPGFHWTTLFVIEQADDNE